MRQINTKIDSSIKRRQINGGQFVVRPPENLARSQIFKRYNAKTGDNATVSQLSENCGISGKYNEPSQRFVQCTQIPALVVAQRKGCWNVKIAARNDPKGRVVKWWSTALPVRANTAPIGQQPLFSFSTKITCIDTGYFFHSRSFAPCQYGGSVHVRQNDMGGALYAFKARLNRETRITVP